MRKIADFIVEKRYYILGVILVICILCACMTPFVKINKDLTKYLPDTSPMKEGLDIMKEEFPLESVNGDIRVMFTGLQKERIPEVKKTLESIKNIDGVEYNSSEKYNKDEYTLFVVKCNYPFQSPEESAVEKDIKEAFRKDEIVVQNVFAITTIPPLVIIVALTVLAIVLLIMCASWFEPLLFLATIGIAVVINLGTNLMFGEISETTFSMTAILQFALSMDYSIILMNRYRIERKKNDNRKEAMKSAFVSSFPSIVSSGVTTVIGLLMLVFMRFKIGLDLGLVMAKGVALSMICVLTVLPALIIISDKLIIKTAKKEPKIPTKSVADFGYRARNILIPVFCVLLVGTGIFQSFAGISYSQPKDDKIEKIFPSSNQIVLLFDNQDEENIKNLMDSLESQDEVNMALSYIGVMGKPMTLEQMEKMTSEVGFEAFDKSLLSVVYYCNKKGDNLPKMTVEEIVRFINEEMLDDEKYSGFFDDKTKESVRFLSKIANKKFLIEEKTSQELANLIPKDKIPVDKSQIDLIYSVYFASKNSVISEKMTLNRVINLLNKIVSENSAVSSRLPEDALKIIKAAQAMTNKTLITTVSLPANLVSSEIGIDIETVNKIYSIAGASDSGMTLYDFVTFTVEKISSDPVFAQSLKEKDITLLSTAKKFMDISLSGKEFTVAEMTELLNFSSEYVIDEKYIKIIYAYSMVLSKGGEIKASLYALSDFIANNLIKDPDFSLVFDEKTKSTIILLNSFVNDIVKEKEYDYKEIAKVFGAISNKIDENKTELLYILWGSKYDFDKNWTLTAEEMLNYVTNDLINDEKFSAFIKEEQKVLLKKISAQLSGIKSSLISDKHSILLLDVSIPEESKETTEFVNSLKNTLDKNLKEDYYLIGNSPMNVEMEENFHKDLLLITLLTAFAIFAVVALTFKSLIIPLLLVLLVQCGVFITVSVSALTGHSMYYLALLIVQCILMGATIDYAIVFTNHYINFREINDVKESLHLAFHDSIHTILTSGLIISLITGVIAVSPTDPSISQICATLAVGTVSAILLIIFVLPGLLAAFDKLVIKKKKEKIKSEGD